MVDQPVISPAPGAVPPTKPVWQSKTLWVAVITAAAPFIPAVGAFVQANPTVVSVAVGLVFSVLRLATRGAVTVKP